MWRYHPDVIALRDRIAAGEFGRIVRTHGWGVHAGWGPSGWFTDPALAGGGALIDMGIHAIDTARFLLGDPDPVRVGGLDRLRRVRRLRGRRRRRGVDRLDRRRAVERRVRLVAAAPRRPRGRHRGARHRGHGSHLDDATASAGGLRPLRGSDVSRPARRRRRGVPHRRHPDRIIRRRSHRPVDRRAGVPAAV